MRLRDWQKTTVLAAASCVFVLFVAELLARLLWDPGAYRPVIRADPVYGWALSPGTHLHSVDTDRHLDYDIRVNTLGMRDRERAPEKPQGKRRVLLLGDSMIFGTGVAAGARCGDVLEARLGPDVEVLNAAVGGWGTDQEFLYLCREGFALEPDVVVLALCLSNDVANNMMTHELYGTAPKPRFVLESDTLRYVPSAPRPAPTFAQRLRRLGKSSRLLHYVGRHVGLLQRRPGGAPSQSLPYHDEDLDSERSHWAVFKSDYSPGFEAAFQVTERLIAAMQDSCNAHGISFVLFAFPQKAEIDPEARTHELAHFGYDPAWFDLKLPYARLERLADRRGILFVHPLDEFRAAHPHEALFFARDGHPNAAGHRLAALTLSGPVREALEATGNHATRR